MWGPWPRRITPTIQTRESSHGSRYSRRDRSGSRLEGATKYLNSRLLITGATHRQLDHSFHPRCLLRVRVINITGPLELYVLADPSRPGWFEARTQCEKALELFEKDEYGSSGLINGELGARYPDDGPTLVLLYCAVQCLVEEPSASEPAWESPGK